MNRTLILLPERHFALAGGQKVIQSEMEAVDVSAFLEIVPAVRVKLDTVTPAIPGQSGSGYTTSFYGITVGFLGSSHVAYRDESNLSGSRWRALAESVTIHSQIAPNGGVTFGTGAGQPPSLGKLSVNPGLILCTITNNEVSTNQSMILEVSLVCRGP